MSSKRSLATIYKKPITNKYSSPNVKNETGDSNEFQSPSIDLETPIKRQKFDEPISKDTLTERLVSPGYDETDSRYHQHLSIKKIFNDPIHHSIQLDDLSVRIIDTPEFQRLEKLKQLGTTSYVFRGATHTRFEHSIGVSYLAEMFAKHLKDHQSELNITNIAGLCHDLGHGPYSHVYDGVFIPLINKINGKSNKWRHEDGSVNMFRHLLDSNNINLEDYNLTSLDKVFIEEIIAGTPEKDRKGRGPDKWYLYDIVNNSRSGLDVDKLDYFQRDMKYTNVVMNTNFERFIQLARVLPSEPLNLDSSIHEYPLMICYPEKVVREAVDLFRVRFRMHGTVYTHKSVKQIEFMVTDALILANDYIFVRGSINKDHPDGRYRMSECIDDMMALSNLDDSIIDIIKADSRPELLPAQRIIERLKKRLLYVNVGKSSFSRGDNIYHSTEDKIKQELVEISQELITQSSVMIPRYDDESYQPYDTSATMSEYASNIKRDLQSEDNAIHESSKTTQDDIVSKKSLTYHALSPDDIIVEKMHIHYGLKDKNPVSRMRFFSKINKSNSNRGNFSHIIDQHIMNQSNSYSQSSALTVKSTDSTAPRFIGREIPEKVYESELPRKFEEYAVRVFCRSTDSDVISMTRRCFEIWCDRKQTHAPFPSLSQQDGLLASNILSLSQSIGHYENGYYGSP